MQWSYATQSAVTEPGVYHGLLDGLPSHSVEVARVVQGLVYHYSSGKAFFGYEPPKERIPEIDTRMLEQMLERIVAEELTTLWHEDKRLGVPAEVNCFSPAIGPHPVKIERH